MKRRVAGRWRLTGFGDGLKLEREWAGLTRMEAARRAGIRPAYLAAMEGGWRPVAASLHDRLLAACETTDACVEARLRTLPRRVHVAGGRGSRGPAACAWWEEAPRADDQLRRQATRAARADEPARLRGPLPSWRRWIPPPRARRRGVLYARAYQWWRRHGGVPPRRPPRDPIQRNRESFEIFSPNNG